MLSRRLVIAVFAALTALLVLHAYRYLPYLSDDALVALRYAKRWAGGDGLTWTDGERVEGYASLLWVVLTGSAGRLGLDYVAAARALGLAGVFTAVVAAGLEPRAAGLSPLRLAAGGALILVTAPFLIAAIGGLEHAFVAGMLALSLRLLERAAYAPSRRALWAASAPLAGLALLRPDGIVLVLAALAGAACLPAPNRASLERSALTALPSVAVVAAHAVFRRLYHGTWLPPGAFAFSHDRLLEGLAYAGHGYSSVSMLVLFALAASVFALRRGERLGLILPWSVAVAWTACVALGGGDASPGYRELLPAFVPLCFVVADELTAYLRRARAQRALALPLAALGIGLHGMQGIEVTDNRRVKDELWVWDAHSTGQLLQTAFADEAPLLAADNAAVPFWSELPSIDLRAANPERRRGAEEAAQEDDRAFAAEVLRRAPDLVVFASGDGTSRPRREPARTLFRTRTFRRGYELVRVTGHTGTRATGHLYVRWESDQLGVKRTPDRHEVPGYFLAGRETRASARLDAKGQLAAEVSAHEAGVMPELELPKGRWKLVVHASKSDLVADLRCNRVSMDRSAGTEAAPVIELDEPSRISLALAAPGTAPSALIRAVAFERDDSPSPAWRCRGAGPLQVSAARLRLRRDRDTHFAHPLNVMFGEAGVAVDLGGRSRPEHLELSLSGNDAYTVELRRGGKLVWTGSVDRRGKKKRPIPRLGVRHFDLPKGFPAGTYELFVHPRGKSGPWVLGHVALD